MHDISDDHRKFQLRSGAARMLSIVELPIGNLATDMNHQVCLFLIFISQITLFAVKANSKLNNFMETPIKKLIYD